MKKLEKIVGLAVPKARVNDIIAKIKLAIVQAIFFCIPNIKLGGPTGMGKTYLAEAIAEAIGWQFICIPPQAGWTFWRELALKTASINEETGEAYGIPTVILVDEAHDQKTLLNMFKLVTGHSDARMHERNGIKFYSDPSKHLWIFASNEKLDVAIERRCGAFNLELPPYNKGEKKQLLALYSEKEIDDDALEYLESRVKPTAGEVQNLANAANVEVEERLTLAVAKRVVQKVGLFPGGIVRQDLQLLKSIMEGKGNLDALKWVAGDNKVSTTKTRLGWLTALSLVEPKRSQFSLTKQGVKYMTDLVKAQQAEKAKA